MKKPTWIFARESEYTLSISSLLQAYFKSLERPFLMSSIHSLTLLSHSYSNTHTQCPSKCLKPSNKWKLCTKKNFSELNPNLLNSFTHPLDKAKSNVTTNLFNCRPYRFWGLLATNLCWNILSPYPFPATVRKSEFDCSFPRQNQKLNHERNERYITKHCLLQLILCKCGI